MVSTRHGGLLILLLQKGGRAVAEVIDGSTGRTRTLRIEGDSRDGGSLEVSDTTDLKSAADVVVSNVFLRKVAEIRRKSIGRRK
jgi:hypothetical protein